ncbi:RloB domain-containing protein [Corynebacterium lizhenjunii]|uniref:RloB domain-containing protein n=1 Tax=Corynebacterium lizhenjunii TaxID=2709394 RepID=A0A7T0PA44_9CORY|nr:RloB domain-containing protein [Corynebacterium lizhenjunii]
MTEPRYFEGIQRQLERVQIVVDPKPGRKQWESNPRAVVEHCVERRNNDLKDCGKGTRDKDPFRAVFAVVDVDQWDLPPKGGGPSQLQQAISLAQAEGVNLIISNCKFEVWLLYHVREKIGVGCSSLSSSCESSGLLEGKNLSKSFPFGDYKVACQRADSQSLSEFGNVGSYPSTAMPRFFDIVA